ncbi:MAG: hypothetical protein K2M93_09695, partial [Muribaculaceae bacterium]|nr:hypothetical protein [Muribaculaceae bacterium]
MNKKLIVKMALSGLLMTSGALISSAGELLSTPVRISDGSLLSWQEFVDAVKDCGRSVSNEEVDVAYKTYKNCQEMVTSTKTAYDSAKNDYEAAEKQLKEWQDTLTVKNQELAELSSTISTLNSQVSTYSSQYSTYSSKSNSAWSAYYNWPYTKENVVMKKGADDFIDTTTRYIYNRLGTSSNYIFSKIYSWAVYIWVDNMSVYADAKAPGDTSYGQNTVEQIASALSGNTNGLTVYLYTNNSLVFSSTGSSTAKYTNFYNIKSISDLESKISTLIANIKANDNNYTFDKVYSTSSYGGYSNRDAAYSDYSYYNRLASTASSNKSNAQTKLNAAQTNYNNTQAVITTLTNQINGYTKVQSGKTESEQSRMRRVADETKVAYEQAIIDEIEATLELNDILEAYRKSIDRYQSITLADDVDASVPLGTYYGTINGDGHTLNVKESAEDIFSDFHGTLINVAINGEITDIDAKLQNVAYWNGKTNGFYSDETGEKTSYNDLGELGFNVRKHFGVDFTNNVLLSLTPTNKDRKVYNLTLYNSMFQTESGYYQITSDRKLINAMGDIVDVPVNRFVLSATSDVDDIAVPNVFYSANENIYMSNHVEIDLNGENFFCPENITAKKVTLKGNIPTHNGRAGICFPFALKQEYFANGTSLCTFNKDNGTSFVFTKVASDIPAHTPVLIFSKQSNVSIDLSEAEMIHIAQTVSNFVISGRDMPNSRSYGILEPFNAQSIEAIEEHDECTVFALREGIFSPTHPDNYSMFSTLDDIEYYDYEPKIKPFCMMVSTMKNEAYSDNACAPRYVSVVDEFGKEIMNTSGIDCVEAPTGTFEVIRGDGEIIVNSDSDRGMMEVYDLMGRA